jgi:hypothetical protein
MSKKEFTAYGRNAEIVKQMVVHDDPKETQKLYSTLNVPYIEDVKVAFDAVATGRTRIACTHIKFLDSNVGDTTKEEYHAVCFVCLHPTLPIYFFDPNGAVLDDSDLKFVVDSTFMTTDTLMTTLKRGRVLDTRFGHNEGVQAFSTSTKSSKYINGGGYCMFYIYLFMEYITSLRANISTVNLEMDKIINYTYTEHDSGIFPTKYKIAEKSFEIIEKAFPSP